MTWVLLIESCQYVEVTLHRKIVISLLTANCVPCQTVCTKLNRLRLFLLLLLKMDSGLRRTSGWNKQQK